MDLGGCRNYRMARRKKNLRSQGGPPAKKIMPFSANLDKNPCFFAKKITILFSLIYPLLPFSGLRAVCPSDLYVKDNI